MKLDWNIKYQIFSKYIYPIDSYLFFEIPIKNNIAYMKQDLLEYTEKFIIILDTKKFIQAWRTSKNDARFSNYHIGNEEIWRADRKFYDAEQGFKEGFQNPVPIPSEIGCSYYEKGIDISFSNHFTRTIWLLANQAEFIPIATAHLEIAHIFHENMGRDGCSIYSTKDIFSQWWQTNQQKFPQAPDDWIPE